MSLERTTLLDLARHEQGVLADYGERMGPAEEIQVQPPGGQGQVAVAEIVAVNDTTFSCKFHDADGAPTGEEFTVYAFSLPVINGRVGQQPLNICDPHWIVGDLLRVEYRNQYVGEGVSVAGWWAVAEFTAFECEISECTGIP